MSGKSLGILLGILLLLGVGFFLTQRGDEAREEVRHHSLFEDLAKEKISKIKIERGDKTFELAESNGIWVVPAKHNYPADAGKVRSLLLKLLDMTVSQQIADSADNFDALGVSDAGVKRGLTRISLIGDTGAEFAALYLGEERQKKNQASGGGRVVGQYVRRSNSNSVYLIPDTMDLSTALPSWLDSAVVNILKSKIRSVAQSVVAEGDEKEEFVLERDITQAKGSEITFTMAGLKSGEVLNQSMVSMVASGLENARTGDVFKSEDEVLKGKNFDLKTTYLTDTALKIEVSTSESAESVYAKFAVSLDSGLAENLAKETAAKTSITTTSPGTVNGQDSASSADGSGNTPQISTAEDATRINAKLGGWVFEFPKYAGNKFRQRRGDLLEKKS